MTTVKIKQFKNKKKEPVAGLTPEHAIYDTKGVRLDAKLGNINLQEFRDLQQQGINSIKQQETNSIQAVADREAEILTKSDASEISTNTEGLEGNNVQNNLNNISEKLTKIDNNNKEIRKDLGYFYNEYTLKVTQGVALNYTTIALKEPLISLNKYLIRIEYDIDMFSEKPIIKSNYLDVITDYVPNEDCIVICVYNSKANSIQFKLDSEKVLKSGIVKVSIANYTSIFDKEQYKDFFSKKVSINPGTNLLDINKLLKGIRIASSGIVIDTERCAITDKIYWKDNKYMTCNCVAPGYIIRQYDKNDNKIGTDIDPNTYNPFTVEKIEGAEYIRFTIIYKDSTSVSRHEQWQIQYGQKSTEFVPYNDIGGFIEQKNIPEIVSSIYEEKMQEEENKQKISLTSNTNYGDITKIDITTNIELNNISDTINNLYLEGKRNLIFIIHPGTYVYKHNALAFDNKNYSDLSIQIIGINECVLIGASETTNSINKYTIDDDNVTYEKEYWSVPCSKKIFEITKYSTNNGKTYNYKYVINNIVSPTNLIELSSITEDKELQVTLTSDLIEILDTNQATLNIISHDETLCRVKCNIDKNYSEEECSNAVIFTNWRWLGNYSKIQKIEDGYIYFYYPSINPGANASYSDIIINGITYKKPSTWSVNDDFHYNNLKQLRYSIHNLGNNGVSLNNGILKVPYSIKELYITTASAFATLNNSTIGYLGINGIKYLGNSFNPNNHCININNTVFNDFMEIKNCVCEGLGGGFVSTSGKNIIIDNCSFIKCSNRAIIYSTNNSENIQVCNCYFEESNNIRQYAYFAVETKGKNNYIGYNVFKNSWHAAISLGELIEGVDISNTTEVSCICEFNEIYSDTKFMQKMHVVGPNDFGAIYTNPNSTNTIIRYNYIEHISGPCEGVGIYNDDGSSGISEYCNIIIDIPKSDALYFRRVIGSGDNLDTQTTPSGKFYNNTNNFALYNFVFGGFKFQGRIKYGTDQIDDSNILGINFIFYDTITKPKITVDTLIYKEDPILIHNNFKIQNFKIVLDNSLYEQFSNLNINNKFFKKYFNRISS